MAGGRGEMRQVACVREWAPGSAWRKGARDGRDAVLRAARYFIVFGPVFQAAMVQNRAPWRSRAHGPLWEHSRAP